MTTTTLPDFDDLPTVPGHEATNNPDLRGCAWGLWGKHDELGTVNLLTPEVVAQAARECIRDGINIRLDGPLNFPSVPAFGRLQFQHEILPMISKAARDDSIYFNPQSGAQWDGLRHYGVTDLDLFYDGVSNEEIPLGKRRLLEGQITERDTRLSIHHWAEHGINGRGVLLDVARYAEQVGLSDFDPFGGVAITAQQLEAVAKLEGVSFRTGDILLVRLGSTKAYLERTPEERLKLGSLKTATFSGVEQSLEMKRFLWNNHFSALVGDSISFERLPTLSGRKMLHQTILGLWGCPIGELFDLERLSVYCAQHNRYTFFFNSQPLVVIGGVSSPPCAAAIF